MEDKTTVVIDIQLDENKVADRLAKVNQEMSSLRSENAQLRKDVKEGTKTWQDVSVQLAANEAKLKTLKAEQSALSGQVAQATQKNREYGTSLKEQSAMLEDLRNRYKSLNEEQRNSEGGQALLEQIQELDSEMKATDATMGLFQRNVGDYTNSIVKAFGLTGNAAKAAGSGINFALGQVANGLKAVIAIPIVAAIGLLAVAVTKVRDAFKRSEEATMGLREALAPLQPLTDAVRRGFDAFATVIVKTVGVAIDGLVAGIGGLLTALQKVGNFFGADWHMGDNFKAATTAARELKEAENDYITAKRAWSVESARIDREVADLREKASDKERYNAQQRLDFLDKAIALETKKAQQEKALAQQNLANLQAEAKRSANDAAMNDRLAEAERAVIEADKNLADTKRTLNRERQRAVNEINGVTSATARNTKAVKDNTDAVADNTEELARQAKEYHDKTVSEMQKAEDALNGIIIDAFAKRRAIEETAYRRRKAELTEELEAEKAAHGEGTALALAYNLQLEALEEQHAINMADIKADEAEREAEINRKKEEDAARTAENIKKIERSRLEYTAEVASSLSSLMKTVAGDNEQMVKASKVVALAEVAIKQGVAISEAVASSAAGDPYTYAIRVAAAVASTVAAMAKAIASINSASFETGGVIGGFHGATRGRDNTYIHAREGELVLDADQQKELFEIANGRGSGVNMAAELAAAIRTMPAPVLDYKEFTAFQSNVATISENSKLK